MTSGVTQRLKLNVKKDRIFFLMKPSYCGKLTLADREYFILHLKVCFLFFIFIMFGKCVQALTMQL